VSVSYGGIILHWSEPCSPKKGGVPMALPVGRLDTIAAYGFVLARETSPSNDELSHGICLFWVASVAYRKFKRYFATAQSGMHPLGCSASQASCWCKWVPCANSILATAYCQHLAAPYGLKVPGMSAGTQSDAAASLQIALQ